MGIGDWGLGIGPFKYQCDGSGRDWYIASDTGLSHDQKPLCGYNLNNINYKIIFYIILKK